MTTNIETDISTVVIDMAAERFGVEADDIRRVGRVRVTRQSIRKDRDAILLARSVVCRTLYDYCEFSYPQIAQAIGWSTHTGAFDFMNKPQVRPGLEIDAHAAELAAAAGCVHSRREIGARK